MNDDSDKLQRALGQQEELSRALLKAIEDSRPLRNSSQEYCSFCLKAAKEPRLLIAGPEATICRDCVSLCVEAFREKGIEL